MCAPVSKKHTTEDRRLEKARNVVIETVRRRHDFYDRFDQRSKWPSRLAGASSVVAFVSIMVGVPARITKRLAIMCFITNMGALGQMLRYTMEGKAIKKAHMKPIESALRSLREVRWFELDQHGRRDRDNLVEALEGLREL
jgi:hypothetical protein